MSDAQYDEREGEALPPSPSSEVGCPPASPSVFRQKPDDGEEKWRLILKQQNQKFLALLQAMQSPVSNNKIQLPEFDPEKQNVDARAWVTTADMCMSDCELQGAPLMITLSRALKGQASTWLSQISFPGMTWSEFKEIFSARYDCPETPATTLINLSSSTPNEGESLAAYSARMLTLLTARWKNLTVEQIAISTVLAHMSPMDQRVQRLAFTTDINTRSKLQKELLAISFLKRKQPNIEGFHDSDTKRFKPTPTLATLECYRCGKTGHKAIACQSRKDPLMSGGKSSRGVPAVKTKDVSSVTCFKCKGQGHYANRCTAAGSREGPGSSGINSSGGGAGAAVEHRRVDMCVVNAPTGI